MKTIVPLICCFFTLFAFAQADKKNNPSVFEEELFSQFPNVRDLSIMFDHSEMYFTIQDHSGNLSFIGKSVYDIDGWGKISISSFSGKYRDLEPFLSPDGLRLYFASNRPLDSSSMETKDFDIWYVQRNTVHKPWSEPIHIGAPVNTEFNEYYPAVTNAGTMYFTSDRNKEQLDDIFVSSYREGNFTEPISLGSEINSKGYEFNAYISPDDSFLIFSGFKRKGGLGGGDIYISFKDGDNRWSIAKNLGPEFNSSAIDYCPFFDIKNNILYFTSRRNSVPSQFEKPQSLQNMLEYFKLHENGLSKFYRSPIDLHAFKKN